jgi:RNA polymerase sigma-70 factor, ECF subfamily
MFARMENDAPRYDPQAAETFLVVEAWARPRLLRYFVASGAARLDADDLVQETLVSGWRGLAQLRQPDKLIPWLFAIARRVRSAYRRRRGAERARLIQEPVEDLANWAREGGHAREAQAPLADDARTELARVRCALRLLPAQQRRCLVLRVDQELSYEAIADRLGLSAHTVRNHLAKARRALRNGSRQVTGRTATGASLVERDEADHLSDEGLARRAG